MLSLYVAVLAWQGTVSGYREDLNVLLDSFRTYGAYVREDRIDFETLRAA